MKIQYESLTIRQAVAADAKQPAAWWNDGAAEIGIKICETAISGSFWIPI